MEGATVFVFLPVFQSDWASLEEEARATLLHTSAYRDVLG